MISSPLKGYTGRSASQLLLSKLPGYRMLQPDPGFVKEPELSALLAMRDLSDPKEGPHAMQLLLRAASRALSGAYHIPEETLRPARIVGVDENYGRLGFNTSAIDRDRRHSYRLDDWRMLRTHMSSAGPAILSQLSQHVENDAIFDRLFTMPGLVYRREEADHLHSDIFHQADYWRVRRGSRFHKHDLHEMVEIVLSVTLPDLEWQVSPASHPYTHHARQINVRFSGEWWEIGECGILQDRFLEREGLDPRAWSGMLFGVGLDRILMARKNIHDIGLLRSPLGNVQAQMGDLMPYRDPGATYRTPALVRPY